MKTTYLEAYFLCMLVISCLLGCPKGGDLPSPGPAPGHVPSSEMQKIVAEIVPISDSDYAAFYWDFADVLERDSENQIVKTTGQFREAYIRAGQLFFQKTDMGTRYPGTAVKIDAAIVEAIGLENVSLDRARTVEILKAIAWACQ